MPSGSLIAGYSVRALANGVTMREVIFWERNGLRHGEFPLPASYGDIHSLDFSLDSTLLAAYCISSDSKQEQHSVLIFYRSNWKWFCKQVISTNALVDIRWMFNKK